MLVFRTIDDKPIHEYILGYNDSLIDSDMINPNKFFNAHMKSRQYSGMPSFGVVFHPHECLWAAEVSFACGIYFQGLSYDVNTAIDLCLETLEKYQQYRESD